MERQYLFPLIREAGERWETIPYRRKARVGYPRRPVDPPESFQWRRDNPAPGAYTGSAGKEL